jgi:ATP-binding cassette subfamily B protein
MPPHGLKKDIEGNIVFDQVGFTYPNTGIRALHRFSLQIKKGQKVAIVGKTGSGKTTLAQLLLRMYDPQEGKIEMDQKDLKEFDLKNLRNQISYVPQDVFLFSDTVSGNIRFGMGSGNEEEVRQAASYAAVEKEIQDFSSQFATLIGERGVTLSGGQKQRISIARALIKNPKVLLLDDCLSAIDANTEKEILSNLNSYLKDRTAIIITHRIFALFDFDLIVVLDEGEIVEKGTHRELMEKNGYYAYLYDLQQQKEE